MEALSWKSPQTALLLKILDRLPVPDYLRFPAVCLSWQSAQTEHCPDRTSSTRQLPWLMLPEDENSPELRLFYSLSEKRYYKLPAPVESQGKNCVGSSHGWLIFLDDEKFLFLVNPLTGLTIEIAPPPRPPSVRPKFSVRYGALSTSPTDPKCLVLVWDYDRYFFYRMGNQDWISWSCPHNPDDEEKFRNNKLGVFDVNPVILEGDLYVACGESDLDVLDPVPNPFKKCLKMADLPSSMLDFKFLLEVDGEIWVICLTTKDNDIEVIEVFKADISGKVWVKLESFGDRVMFLGLGCTLCLPAVNTGGPGNRIFHTYLLEGNLLWTEYDYISHQVVKKEHHNLRGKRFMTDLLHWIEPSYPQK